MQSDEPCGRCLVVVNAASFTVCRDLNKPSSQPIEYKAGAGRPRDLRDWYYRMMKEVSNPEFQIDALPNMMIPVTTWHGDPVCGWHLIECRQAEWEYMYPRSGRRR